MKFYNEQHKTAYTKICDKMKYLGCYHLLISAGLIIELLEKDI